MPKTKFQSVVFALLMSLGMVYGMICYNIALGQGGMTNHVFGLAFHELFLMWAIAFILEFAVVGNLARKIAFKVVTPGVDKPIFIVLAMSSVIVAIMCPVMSFIATLLFHGFSSEFIAQWLKTAVLNFPMAFFLQVMYCGPFVRWIFRKIFDRQPAKQA